MREVLCLVLIVVLWIAALSERVARRNVVNPQKSTIEEHWKTSSLDVEDLKESFSADYCFGSSYRETLECLNGFNEAGALTEPKQALWPRSLETDPAVVRVLRRLGAVTHVEILPGAESSARSQREFLRKRFSFHRAMERAAIDLFKSHHSKSSPELSFLSLLLDAKERLSPHTPKAMYVGAALSGQLSTRDPHSYLAPGSLFHEWMAQSSFEKRGVGIVLHPSERGYRVYEVIAGSAAERAGLKAFDLIRSIDGEEIDFRLSQDEITSKLEGVEGSEVELTIERGTRRVKFSQRLTLRRAKFEIRNVTVSSFRQMERVFSHLRIRSFLPSGLCSEVETKLREVERSEVSGIVLDLRGNLGGSVEEAACVAGLFVGKGELLVHTVSLVAASEKTQYASIRTNRERVTTLPLVILVNEMSASAAEIVAGSLRDHGRARLLGERSFGKGTIQTLHDHRSDPSGTLVALTEQAFILPSGETNQGHGLEPDFEVPLIANFSRADRWSAREADLFPNAVVIGVTDQKRDQKRNQKRRSDLRNRIASCLSRLDQTPIRADRQFRAAILTLGCEIDESKFLAANP